MTKQIANIITSCRILCSIVLTSHWDIIMLMVFQLRQLEN